MARARASAQRVRIRSAACPTCASLYMARIDGKEIVRMITISASTSSVSTRVKAPRRRPGRVMAASGPDVGDDGAVRRRRLDHRPVLAVNVLVRVLVGVAPRVDQGRLAGALDPGQDLLQRLREHAAVLQSLGVD